MSAVNCFKSQEGGAASVFLINASGAAWRVADQIDRRGYADETVTTGQPSGDNRWISGHSSDDLMTLDATGGAIKGGFDRVHFSWTNQTEADASASVRMDRSVNLLSLAPCRR